MVDSNLPAPGSEASSKPQDIGQQAEKAKVLISSCPVENGIDSTPSEDDGQPPTLPARAPRGEGVNEQWKVHWGLPFLMASQYVLGAALAVGHHFYYVSLDATAVAFSQWPLKVGTAIAFITQRCFVGAAQVASMQCTWVSTCESERLPHRYNAMEFVSACL
jgi:hypothetical protein